MKLIIDIPEKNFIKDDLIHFFGCYSEKLDEVIKNGTPLEDAKDKIKAELHATAEMHDDGNYYLRDEWIDEYF